MSTHQWLARPGRVAVLLAASFLMHVAPAQAYLDPGTGSLAVQMLIGGAAAAVVGFANYRDKLLHWLRRRSRGRAADASQVPGDRAPAADDAPR